MLLVTQASPTNEHGSSQWLSNSCQSFDSNIWRNAGLDFVALGTAI